MLINISGEPPRTTAQEKKIAVVNGRPRVYTTKAVSAAQAYYRGTFEAHAIGHKPIEGPIRLSVMFGFGTDDKQKLRQLWKTTRPDTDNMVKILKDELTRAGIWNDDAQVTEEWVRKMWVPRADAGTSILIEELEVEE